jgi:hypothetical protein
MHRPSVPELTLPVPELYLSMYWLSRPGVPELPVLVPELLAVDVLARPLHMDVYQDGWSQVSPLDFLGKNFLGDSQSICLQ